MTTTTTTETGPTIKPTTPRSKRARARLPLREQMTIAAREEAENLQSQMYFLLQRIEDAAFEVWEKHTEETFTDEAFEAITDADREAARVEADAIVDEVLDEVGLGDLDRSLFC